MKRGCPECEVTKFYQEFLEELDGEFAQLAEEKEFCLPGRGREHKWRWTREKLIQDVGAISTINARVDGKGYSGDWPIHIKNLVMILRQEQALQDRIAREDAERQAEREAANGRRQQSTK